MRQSLRIFVIVFLLFTSVGGVNASELFEQEMCNLSAEQDLDGDVFVVCGELVVDGEIDGNLIGIARNATINGTVNGGVYLAGVQLDVNGAVEKDLHYAGLSLSINQGSQFSDDSGVLTASLSSTIAPETQIPGSVIALGYQLIINGDVGREVSFWGSALEISGNIGDDVTATVGNADSDGTSTQIERLLIPFSLDVTLVDPGLRLMEIGRVTGDLDYTGPSPASINGRLEGVEVHNDTSQAFPSGEPTAAGFSIYISNVLSEFLTLGFIGIIGLVFVPRHVQAPLRPMQVHPISTFGVGMLSFIMSFPIVLILMLLSALIVVLLRSLPIQEIVTVGGIVLALANVGSAGLFYFTAIYISRVIVALAIGRIILRLMRRYDNDFRSLALSLAIGLLLLSALSAVPIIGWLFTATALFMGLGAILSVVRRQIQRFREAPPVQPSPTYYEEPISILSYFQDTPMPNYTPPRVDAAPPPAGADNLPPGFDWWGDDTDPD